MLIQYGVYGKDRANYLLSNKQVESITSQELMGIIKNLLSYEHKILYYGTEDTKSLASMLSKYHKINDNLKPVPAPKKFVMQETTKDRVLFVPFDASQASLYTYTRSIPYDSKLYPDVEIYNQYFGDGMNSIVFQEIREKRALAYSAYSYFTGGRKADGYYANYASIGTQNDKMVDAFDAFNDLFNNIPNSSVAFDLAKEGLIAKLETSRITKAGIYRYYLSQNKLGINYDNRKDLYNALPEYTMNSITAFNQKYIKNQPKTYLVVAREGETNFDALKKYGEIQKLTLEDIFGY